MKWNGMVALLVEYAKEGRERGCLSRGGNGKM